MTIASAYVPFPYLVSYAGSVFPLGQKISDQTAITDDESRTGSRKKKKIS